MKQIKIDSSTQPFFQNVIPVQVVNLLLEFIPEENHQRLRNFIPDLLAGKAKYIPVRDINYVAWRCSDLINTLNYEYGFNVEVITAAESQAGESRQNSLELTA